MGANQVQVNLTLTIPPLPLSLPLASDPSLSASVSPPLAHTGPGPVHMRLISCDLREGQVSLHRHVSARRSVVDQPRHSSYSVTFAFRSSGQ